MKQFYRDLIFLSLLPITFLVLFLEPKTHLFGWEHKLGQMIFIVIIYLVVWFWVRFDVKQTDRNFNIDYTINVYPPEITDEK